MKQWQRDYGGGLPDEVHPINDLKDHLLVDSGQRCWCGAKEDEGVIVHDSADGREKFETGERKRS